MSEAGEDGDEDSGTDAEVEVVGPPPEKSSLKSPDALEQFEDTAELPRIDPPGFADPSSPKRVDPWNEPTPRELPDDRRAAFVEPEPEESPYTGDGPFAAALDHPSAGARDRSREERGGGASEHSFRADLSPRASSPRTGSQISREERPRVPPSRAGSQVPRDERRMPLSRAGSEISREERLRVPPPRTVSELAREERARNAFSAPLVVQRRNRMPSTPGRPTPSLGSGSSTDASGALVPRARASSTTGAVAPRRSASGVASPPAQPERKYPKMRALLANPDEVPHGSAPPSRPSRTRPVPGTFFPAPREREAAPLRAAPADLDEMLATMAEGLLIGEGPSGETEVRVTLRDEFFAGTELRIVAGDGRVRAVLHPPDRGTYLTLNGNIDELRMRLEARGLRVEELRVAEP